MAPILVWHLKWVIEMSAKHRGHISEEAEPRPVSEYRLTPMKSIDWKSNGDNVPF